MYWYTSLSATLSCTASQANTRNLEDANIFHIRYNRLTGEYVVDISIFTQGLASVFTLINIKWVTSLQNQQNDLCTQSRLGSAWASGQSDQSSLRCIFGYPERAQQRLIRLGGWAHRSFYWFCHASAHFQMSKIFLKNFKKIIPQKNSTPSYQNALVCYIKKKIIWEVHKTHVDLNLTFPYTPSHPATNALLAYTALATCFHIPPTAISSTTKLLMPLFFCYRTQPWRWNLIKRMVYHGLNLVQRKFSRKMKTQGQYHNCDS